MIHLRRSRLDALFLEVAFPLAVYLRWSGFRRAVRAVRRVVDRSPVLNHPERS